MYHMKLWRSCRLLVNAELPLLRLSRRSWPWLESAGPGGSSLLPVCRSGRHLKSSMVRLSPVHRAFFPCFCVICFDFICFSNVQVINWFKLLRFLWLLNDTNNLWQPVVLLLAIRFFASLPLSKVCKFFIELETVNLVNIYNQNNGPMKFNDHRNEFYRKLLFSPDKSKPGILDCFQTRRLLHVAAICINFRVLNVWGQLAALVTKMCTKKNERLCRGVSCVLHCI